MAELQELLATLRSDSASSAKTTSGAQALLDGIISNGYQLVTASTATKALTSQSLASIQGTLAGTNSAGGIEQDDTLPTIMIVAHYDAAGAAPSLSFGADSNGSGVTILLELARIWSQVYRYSLRKAMFEKRLN